MEQTQKKLSTYTHAHHTTDSVEMKIKSCSRGSQISKTNNTSKQLLEYSVYRAT